MKNSVRENKSAAPAPASAGPLATAAEGFIKKPAVAARMGLTIRAVELMMRRGQIPYYKFGRAVAFRWSEVLAELARTCRHPRA